MADPHTFSLSDLLRLGLESEPQILAGASGLAQGVTWVQIVDPAQLAQFQPAAGELVLAQPPCPERGVLERWRAAGSAGLALRDGELSAPLRAWAEAHAFPILALGAATDLAHVQRTFLRLVVEREAGLVARKDEVFRHLTRLSAENQGIEVMARALHDLTGKGILLHDKRLRVLAAIAPRPPFPWAEMVQAVSAPVLLPAALLDRKRAAEVHTPIAQAVAPWGARLVLPVVVGAMARGFLSLIHSDLAFDALDRLVLEQGAAACALEMAKVKAIREAQKRLTGDLVEAVLSNSVGEVDAERWAERAGYRRLGPHLAMALQWVSPLGPSLRRLETIVSGEVKRLSGRALARLRENEIVVFFALDPAQGLAEAQEWAAHVYDLALAEFPQAHLALGIGRPCAELIELRHSCREAAQAMAIEHKLRHRRPQFFGDLGIYRLLLQLEGTPELAVFANETLGRLTENDRAQGMNLLATLDAYFRHNGNLVQTAQALYIHRNTLLYRLHRAAEIGRFDLDNAETRLALQLALRAHELSRPER